MLCVISFYHGDKDQAIRLANWIRDLGGVKRHDCLLIVDKSTNANGVFEPLSEAFNAVTMCVPSESPQVPWNPQTADATAPNEMWLAAVYHVAYNQKCRWFWLESDAAPTRSTWMDEIEDEDAANRKVFTGARVEIPPLDVHMSGIGVYPEVVWDFFPNGIFPGKVAWDYWGRETIVPRAHFTDLIQHVYRINGISPTFVDQASLAHILPKTAVYHRCKDSSLIDRLRERLPGSKPQGESDSIEAHNLDSVGSTPTPAISDREAKLAAQLENMKAQFAAMKRPVVVRQKRGKSMKKKKRSLTPEHKAKLVVALAKARAAKKVAA